MDLSGSRDFGISIRRDQCFIGEESIRKIKVKWKRACRIRQAFFELAVWFQAIIVDSIYKFM